MNQQQNPVIAEISQQLGQQIIVIAEQRHVIAQVSETAQAALSAMAAAVRDGSVSQAVADQWRKTVPGFAEMGAVARAAEPHEGEQKPSVVHSIKGAKKL